MSLSFGFPVAVGPSHGGLLHGFPRFITVGVQRGIWALILGEWKSISSAYAKVSDEWKSVAVWKKSGGEWAKVL